MEKKKGKLYREPEPAEHLSHPAVGMESEFNIFVDGEEIVPERYWSSPLEFIDQPLLPRMKSSFQLPTGGAVYFDRGVIEVVTPVIEIAPSCAARVVRNLWDQIGFVRDGLSNWEKKTGHEVRMKGYSTHYNVSFDVPATDQSPERNVETLALLLAYILPPPLMLVATNRMSTGVGVRPRGDRIEITLDFTPDPSLMVATASAIIGIVRAVMSWPSYELSELDQLPFPRLIGVVPGKHTTRKGWLTKDVHYPRSPFTTDPDAPVWECTDGQFRTMRKIGLQTALYFRESILASSDAFGEKLLFGVLRGEERSLLDLATRPVAYEHVGVLCRWGRALTEMILRSDVDAMDRPEVVRHTSDLRRRFTTDKSTSEGEVAVAEQRNEPRAEETKRPGGGPPSRKPAWRRRAKIEGPVYDDRRLSRSLYERVFLQLTSGKSLMIENERWVPTGMESWYRAKFRSETDGRETTMSIDELTHHLRNWS